MNEYRVSLWVENQGDIPDFFFHFQMNASPVASHLMIVAMLMAGTNQVCEVEIETLMGKRWVMTGEYSTLSLDGSLFLK